MRKRKVIIHNFTFKGAELYPYVFDCDQRGIITANPGDIVVTRNKPDPNFLRYLGNLGWDFTDVLFLSPASASQFGYTSIFHDPGIIKRLKQKVGYQLDTYHLTVEEENFSRLLRLPLYGDVSVADQYGTKSGFRTLARKLGIPIPDGFENIRTEDQALWALEELFSKGEDTVAIKVDSGAGGAGTTLVEASLFRKQTIAQKRRLVRQALAKFRHVPGKDGAVIEEWFTEISSSQELLVQISPDKRVKTIIYDQLLEGETRQRIGSVFPSSLSLAQEQVIKKWVKIIARELIKQGYVGYFGPDSIMTNKGDIYFVELNIRKVGPFYPYIVAEKLFPEEHDHIFYQVRSITLEVLKGKNFCFVERLLKKQFYPLGLAPKGIVIYNIGPLKKGGEIEFVCFGRSQQEAGALCQQAENLLRRRTSLFSKFARRLKRALSYLR